VEGILKSLIWWWNLRLYLIIVCRFVFFIFVSLVVLVSLSRIENSLRFFSFLQKFDDELNVQFYWLLNTTIFESSITALSDRLLQSFCSICWLNDQVNAKHNWIIWDFCCSVCLSNWTKLRIFVQCFSLCPKITSSILTM
jgi:hypothetical protein